MTTRNTTTITIHEYVIWKNSILDLMLKIYI